jgi:hypothetical protein
MAAREEFPTGYEDTPALVEDARQVARYKENFDSVANLFEQDPEQLARLMADFDSVVALYNVLASVSPDIIPGMDNYQTLKPEVPHLPLMKDLLSSEQGSLARQESLGNLSTLMQRYDEARGEPNTSFHHWQGDSEAHMVFGIFKVYAELVWREQPEADLDHVLDALIEVMPLVLDKDNPVYDAVVNTGRLNWLQDGGPFNPAWAAIVRAEDV